MHTVERAGDRFRALVFLFRLASFTRRVLLLDWADPVGLSHFLQPNRIDWGVDGIAADPLAPEPPDAYTAAWPVGAIPEEVQPAPPRWDDMSGCLPTGEHLLPASRTYGTCRPPASPLARCRSLGTRNSCSKRRPARSTFG